MSEDVRIDPTAVGLLFIGFILFVVGIFGLQCGEILKNYIVADDFLEICFLSAIALFVVAIFAYRAGSLFGTGVFLWVAMALMVINYAGLASWFLYIIVAVFFLIFTAWAFMAGSPKILVGVLVCAALAFLFFGLALNPDMSSSMKTMCDLVGVFALLGFLLSTYLGFALCGVKELPVV